jgi:hypothetical protein
MITVIITTTTLWITAEVRTVLDYSNTEVTGWNLALRMCVLLHSSVLVLFVPLEYWRRFPHPPFPNVFTRDTGCLYCRPSTLLDLLSSGTRNILRYRFPDGPICLCSHTVRNAATISGQSRPESNISKNRATIWRAEEEFRNITAIIF